MPVPISTSDVDAAVFNPASVFKTPGEILEDKKIHLTREQKIRALQTWWMDVKLRLNAGQENMPVEADTEAQDLMLEEKILEALHSLGASASPKPVF